MARSRPRLSQSPWTGMEALQKIMERFAEFGENLNRMAAALHNLENSMQHLLGVTSRVTAAMLLLHGGMGQRQGGGGGGSYDPSASRAENDAYQAEKEKKYAEREADRIKKRHEERLENEAYLLAKEKRWADREKQKEDKAKASEARFKNRDAQEEIRFKLKMLRQKLSNAGFSKQGLESTEDRSFKSMRNNLRKGYEKRVAEVLEKAHEEIRNPEKIMKGAEGLKDLKKKQKQKKDEIPDDKKPHRVIVDTEYGSVAKKGMTHEQFHDSYKELTEDQKNTLKVPTELSVRVVNELGQTIQHFATKLKTKLAKGMQVYSLSAEDQEGQDSYKAKLKADQSDAITQPQAVKEIKKLEEAVSAITGEKFSISRLAQNVRPNAAKISGKNFVNADLPVLTNAHGERIGKALGLGKMADFNKLQQNQDPQSFYFRGTMNLMRGMYHRNILTDAKLNKIAETFDLDPAILSTAVKDTSGKGVSSQENIAALFKHTYAAHNADADTEADALLAPRLKKFFEAVSASMDIDAILAAHGVSPQNLVDQTKDAKSLHDKDPVTLDNRKELEALNKELADMEASELALEKELKDLKDPVKDKPEDEKDPEKLKEEEEKRKEEERKIIEEEEKKKKEKEEEEKKKKDEEEKKIKRENSPLHILKTGVKDVLAALNPFKSLDLSKVLGSSGFGALGSALKKLITDITAGATMLAGAALGGMQMASPDAFATFQGSLQMVGMTLGSAMIGPILTISSYLQQLAAYFDTLSESTLHIIGLIGEYAIYTAAASIAIKGVVAICSPLVTAFTALWTVVKSLATFLNMGLAELMKKGVAGLVGLGGVAVNTLKLGGAAVLAYEALAIFSDKLLGTDLSLLLKLMGQNAGTADKKIKDDVEGQDVDNLPPDKETLENARETIEITRLRSKTLLLSTDKDRSKFKEAIDQSENPNKPWFNAGGLGFLEERGGGHNHPFFKMAKSLGKTFTAAGSNRLTDKALPYAKRYSAAEANYHAALEKGDSNTADINLAELGKIQSEMLRLAKTEGYLPATKPNNPTLLEQRQREFQKFNWAVRSKPGGPNQNQRTLGSKAEDDERARAQKGFDDMGGYNGLVAAFRSFRSQPQYMGVAEAHRRVQIEALKSDPMEQKFNEMQSKYLQKYLDYLAVIASKEDKTLLMQGRAILSGLATGKGS